MVKNDPANPPKAVPAPPPPTPTGEKSYYCGLTDECPLSFITVPTSPKEGAFAIQKYTQSLQDSGNGVYTLSTQTPGGIIKMFDDEYEAVLKYIRSRVLMQESKGDNNRVSIMPKDGEGSFRSRRDEVGGNVTPLSRYVWITRARTVSLEDQEARLTPKTLAEESAAV